MMAFCTSTAIPHPVQACSLLLRVVICSVNPVFEEADDEVFDSDYQSTIVKISLAAGSLIGPVARLTP